MLPSQDATGDAAQAPSSFGASAELGASCVALFRYSRFTALKVRALVFGRVAPPAPWLAEVAFVAPAHLGGHLPRRCARSLAIGAP